MDYSYYVSHQYNFTPSLYSVGDVIYFCSDGERVSYDESEYLDGSSTMGEIIYRVTNDYNRFNLHNTKFVSFVYYYSNNTAYLFNTVSIDYCGFSLGSSPSSNELHVVAEYNQEEYTMDEGEGINNYYQFTANETYHDLLRSQYGTYNLTLTNNSICWFDYSNQKDNYARQNAITIRGENYSIYDTYLTLYLSDLNSDLTYYYGNPIQSQLESEYTRGYGAGHGAGWIEGNDNGYQIGINANGNIDQTPATAFTYIGQGFNAVSQFMNIEVLPHITLGLCFSIPLVFVLIITVFKLVRK